VISSKIFGIGYGRYLGHCSKYKSISSRAGYYLRKDAMV